MREFLHDHGRGHEMPRLRVEMRCLDGGKWRFAESRYGRIGKIVSERRWE